MQQLIQTASYMIFGAALFGGGTNPSFAQGLPGGATTLNETHGDWTVACTTPEGAVRCAVSQVQINNQRPARVSHSWMGFVGYTVDTLAHTGTHDGMHYAMGYCGSGVPMASHLGRRTGQRLLGL